MSAVTAGPPEVEVEYPEGEPVPEDDLHWTRQSEVVMSLRHWLAGHPDGDEAWVSAGINIYYREGDPRVVVAPDVAVAFGVDVAALAGRSTYRVWDAGAPPRFVLEIASPSTVSVDIAEKPARFAELGVEEYWRLDPTGGDLLDPPLAGEHRRRGRWEPIGVHAAPGGALRGHSTALGLDLCWEPPKLRLYDPTARAWLLDPDDRLAAHLAAESRAAAAEAELAALRRNPPPGDRRQPQA